MLLSFLGSLPIGLISITIVQQTIEKGRKAGFLLTLGASIMEFVYCYIALLGINLFSQNNQLLYQINLLATVVFGILGVYYLFKKTTSLSQKKVAYNYLDFFRGILVGAFNMLIIPFWVFIGLWLKSKGFNFDHSNQNLVFSLGATLGAGFAFIGYIYFSAFISKKIDSINHSINKIVGVLFIGLMFFQLFQIFG